jgi:hypothetical protein
LAEDRETTGTAYYRGHGNLGSFLILLGIFFHPDLVPKNAKSGLGGKTVIRYLTLE